METTLGIFTMMAVMAAIIGGGMGVRVMYIDGVYARFVHSETERQRKANLEKYGRERSATELLAGNYHAAVLNQRLKDEKTLSGLTEKRKANRRGVRLDGFFIITILGIGLAASMGVGPGIQVSAAMTFLFFVGAMVTFQSHARDALRLSC